VRPYSASLRLDGVAPVTLGVGSSVYGTGLVGGVGASWSDELGNRNLGVAVQSLGEFRDIGAQVSYVDLGNRWQRGASLARIPYLSTFSTIEEGDIQIDGQTRSATLVNQVIQRIYFDQFQAGTAYPFSPVQRFELGVGATRVTFDRDVRRLAFIGNTGFDLGTTDAPAPDGISFVQGSAALVFDNSIFGFTSPIAGGRYRLEASPAVGGLTFTTVTADYRRYFFARPFTFAMRGLAYGRFGRDAESGEFSPLYLGDGALVRGYSVYSFNPSECSEAANGGSTCPEFDRLLGSRIGVFNVEMRVPLFGTPDFGLFSTRLFPVELAPFIDAGVAWTSNSSPEFVFERNTAERVPIVSAGVASRINLFGALVVEIYGARPCQRPARNWVGGVQLLPGW
jgi:hypothetical protein